MNKLTDTLLGRTGTDLTNRICELGIPRVAAAVLLELNLASDVSAASLGQHVHQGKPQTRQPSFGAGEPAIVTYARRYHGCQTDTDRLAVLTDAIAELTAIRYARHPTIDLQTKDGQREVGRDPRPTRVVAHAYGVSIGTVCNWRKAASAHDAKYPKDRAA